MENKSVDNQWETCKYAKVEYDERKPLCSVHKSKNDIIKKFFCTKGHESIKGPHCFSKKCLDHTPN